MSAESQGTAPKGAATKDVSGGGVYPEWFAAIPEDARERQQFDTDVSRLYEGDPLRAIVTALGIWRAMSPQHGSYAMVLAIFQNEIAKAAAALSEQQS